MQKTLGAPGRNRIVPPINDLRLLWGIFGEDVFTQPFISPTREASRRASFGQVATPATTPFVFPLLLPGKGFMVGPCVHAAYTVGTDKAPITNTKAGRSL